MHDNRARGPCNTVYLRQRHSSRRGERRRGGRLGLGKGLGDALSLLLVRRRVVARLVSVPVPAGAGAHGTARKEEESKQDGLHGKVDFRVFLLLLLLQQQLLSTAVFCCRIFLRKHTLLINRSLAFLFIRSCVIRIIRICIQLTSRRSYVVHGRIPSNRLFVGRRGLKMSFYSR